ncbi:MAG: GTP cyclohydrolase I [Novosphingobium sp.]|nr:GTP cyclohydrolase I [Novosphingobium sp.]
MVDEAADTTAEEPNPVGAPLPPKFVDLSAIERGVSLLLAGLGQADKPEVMANTPRRMAEMFAEMVNPGWCDIEIPWKCFKTPAGLHDLIMITDCHYVSFCEHHLSPSIGIAHFGYVPREKITGYSKVKKALNYLARQPQLNERLAATAVQVLEEVLEPDGVGVILQSVPDVQGQCPGVRDRYGPSAARRAAARPLSA